MVKLTELTKEKLIELYVDKKLSLGDIGRLYNTSRTAIYKKLNKFAIHQRSKSQARLESQKQGKLPQKYFHINEDFFKKWSPQTAYVLGLLITDGCVSKTGVISLCVNDQELLEKVKKALGSEHKITPSEHQKGLYCFYFARKNMVEDLRKIGITPQKSLKVRFPQVPDRFLRDFIRGIFDGDGTVFFEKRTQKSLLLKSKFGAGSKSFVVDLELHLQKLGLPKRTIYTSKTKNGNYFYFVYGHEDSKKLFNILYKDASQDLFLGRKYQKFLQGFTSKERIN